jgi:transposase
LFIDTFSTFSTIFCDCITFTTSILCDAALDAYIAFAGIDAPPYPGSLQLQIGEYLNEDLPYYGKPVMMSLKFNKPENDAVYLYMLKKEMEGKSCKVAKITALNKFLRIYYARVKEAYL